MRNKLFYFSVVFLTLMFANCFAQYTKPDVPLPPPPPEDITDVKVVTVPMSTEESARMSSEMLKWELKLTNEQDKEVYEIYLTAFKKKEKLWEAGEEKVIDKTEMEQRLAKIDEGIDAHLKDILTNEQYEKYIIKISRLKNK